MKARKSVLFLLLNLMVLVSLVAAGCAPAAAPAVVEAPAVAAAEATTAPEPTVAPTEAPAPVEAKFEIQPVLDKYLGGLPDGFGTIAAAKLNEQIAAAKPFLLDVREAKEVTDNGYIEGAVNLPIRTLAQNLDMLPAKDQAIVVYCGSGHRSAVAMAALQMLGYTNVKSLAGGVGAWKKAELPLATGTPAEPTAGTAPEVDKNLQAALDKYLSALPDGFGTIAADKLNEQIGVAKPVLIDVREEKEVTDNGYLADSVNIPIRTLLADPTKLPQDKAAAVVIYCGSGHRSAIAMEALQLLGYTNVKSLAGGFGAWKAANLPIAN